MIGGVLRALLSSFLGTLGFSILIHAPRRAWIHASMIGAFAFTVYWITHALGATEEAAIFFGSFFGALLACSCARKMQMIGTIFMMLAIVSMVPGLGLTRCMELFAEGRSADAAEAGTAAMMAILMIALGLAVGTFFFRLIIGRNEQHTKGRRA